VSKGAAKLSASHVKKEEERAGQMVDEVPKHACEITRAENY
jgi:hypothetical protein